MRLAILTVLLCASFFSKAQLVFPDSSAYWQEFCASGAWGDPSPDGEVFFFLGYDSIVDGALHRTLHIGEPNPWGGFDTLNSDLIGTLRVENQLVFYNGIIRSDDNAVGINEDTINVLLYDFSVLAGDTVQHYFRTDTILNITCNEDY